MSLSYNMPAFINPCKGMRPYAKNQEVNKHTAGTPKDLLVRIFGH